MQNWTITSSPHIRAEDNTKNIMTDVIIALLPCIIAGIIFFGYRVTALLAIAIFTSVGTEHLWCKIMGKRSSIKDLSAVVSAIILTLMLPPTAPLWIPLVGSLFMIPIAKLAFGGLGQNFINPAAAGRGFLLASWPVIMTTWTAPWVPLTLLSNPNVVTTATPLAQSVAQLPSYLSLYIGTTAGCIGETSVLAILIGLIYLLWRRVIKIDVPFIFVAVVFILSFCTGADPVYQILSGGLMFGAVFMATDYSTSPLTKQGSWIYAAGLGVLTFLIRTFGGYPEGVCYSILIMNCLVPLIDKIPTKARVR
ncbi:MAG: RnfABCDGE type electron transport complex subunit D [Clostridiales bacterium]|jgi:electron transport complex protein RnfD|nr:RnfABCDGE type electron transport complex subunit D [Clostridiales bacterium]